jgi:hypothetical protein
MDRWNWEPMSKKAKNDSEPQSPGNDEAPEIESAYPKARPIGIKDIAKALGISIGTVDRAIHSRGGINPITKERVLKMAQTLRLQAESGRPLFESAAPGARCR